MSTDVHALLERAAGAPSRGPDVTGAIRRGRNLRTRRRAGRTLASAAAVVAAVAVGAALSSSGGSGNSRTASHAPTTVAPAARCPALSRTRNDVPAWAAPAHPPVSLPHTMSRERNVVAFVFAKPLVAGVRNGSQNKVLFVVREPRNGTPLHITGRLLSGHATASEPPTPANSGPGEIYPTYVNVPASGCWQFALTWNGNHATIDLAYAAART